MKKKIVLGIMMLATTGMHASDNRGPVNLSNFKNINDKNGSNAGLNPLQALQQAARKDFINGINKTMKKLNSAQRRYILQLFNTYVTKSDQVYTKVTQQLVSQNQQLAYQNQAYLSNAQTAANILQNTINGPSNPQNSENQNSNWNENLTVSSQSQGLSTNYNNKKAIRDKK